MGIEDHLHFIKEQYERETITIITIKVMKKLGKICEELD